MLTRIVNTSPFRPKSSTPTGIWNLPTPILMVRIVPCGVLKADLATAQYVGQPPPPTLAGALSEAQKQGQSLAYAPASRAAYRIAARGMIHP
jgi:hypothetical protein